MAGKRTISRKPPDGKNYYIIDACFLVNKYIPITIAPNRKEQKRISCCQEWWEEIVDQLDKDLAKVYIPDICIAETFKTLSKKHYDEHWFKTFEEYEAAIDQIHDDIVIPSKELIKLDRKIRYHDISTSRDIIISVDRFYKEFMTKKIHVELPDLILVASAKYLIDFFDFKKSSLHIITLDKKLRDGSKLIPEIPNAYDPTEEEDYAEKIFI